MSPVYPGYEKKRVFISPFGLSPQWLFFPKPEIIEARGGPEPINYLPQRPSSEPPACHPPHNCCDFRRTLPLPQER